MGRLSLIATKKYNYWSKSANNNVIQDPQDLGYLYLDNSDEKIYYSANVYNKPEYLFTWNSQIADGAVCRFYVPIITPDGDIIFFWQGKRGRGYPIFYSHESWNTPSLIQTTETVLPGGLTTDHNVCVSTRGEFILFAEYQANNDASKNGEPMRIWKITKPYNNPANWHVVLTKYYSASGSQWGQDPNNEITHFHTIDLDHYTGYFYANTGDASNECRVFESRDDGETWTEIAGGSQEYRCLGYIFTEDGCWWGTDSGYPNHNIYKVSRGIDGVLDFSTMVKKADLLYTKNQYQRVYAICKTRNPDGLLVLDRAEERTDGIYDLQFYSFDTGRVHLLDRLKSCNGSDARYGFGNLTATYYQSTQEDGIITGDNGYDRDMSLAILNNNPTNRLGVTKISVHRSLD